VEIIVAPAAFRPKTVLSRKPRRRQALFSEHDGMLEDSVQSMLSAADDDKVRHHIGMNWGRNDADSISDAAR
jgi:hypothetical protein